MLARLGKLIRTVSRLGFIGGLVSPGVPQTPGLVDRFGDQLVTRAGEDLFVRSGVVPPAPGLFDRFGNQLVTRTGEDLVVRQ